MKSKIIDVLFFVLGSFIIVINLFPQGSKSSNIRGLEGESYYTGDQITFLAIGIAMVVLGFLIRIWRKEKNS